MKLYIATLLKHDEYFITHERTFTAYHPNDLACQVYDYLNKEIPCDYEDILIECTHANESREPLSLGIEEECVEYLLCVSVKDLEA